VTSYTRRTGAPEKTATDVVVVGVVSTKKGPRPVPAASGVQKTFGRRFDPLLSTMGFEATPDQVAKVPTHGVLKSSMLVLVGLGAGEIEGDETGVSPERVRRAAGAAARAVSNAASVALCLPTDSPAHLRAAVEGFALGSYRFDDYRSTDGKDVPREVVVLSAGARRSDQQQAFEDAQVVASAVARTRDWVNTPPGDLQPPSFADAITARTADAGSAKKGSRGRSTPRIGVEVLDEQQLADKGCGGLIGVGKGSQSPPRLVRLTYTPAGARAHLALVGKGITFDSGGLSIKPAASMATMKMDMAGAAAVVNATVAIAMLGLPLRVTTYAPLAENMPSGTATRPGDVLTMYGGRTVEVLNTDAEGRLVLADALVHAVEDEPDCIVDVATLTGACMVALGDRVSGLFGNDDDLVERLEQSARTAGEAVWHMPIPDEMREKVRSNSKIADLAQHNSERWGGASYAAAFLREFVGEVPWAHLDIAGPAYNEKGAYGHVGPGGTGVAVSTLVELARTMAAERS
jgi:leucyl aminopeptidase